MATTIALIIALVVYTVTVVAVNYQKAPEGESLNFDMESAFMFFAEHESIKDVLPEPLNMVVAAVALVIPTLVVFWLVRFIVK